MGLSRPKDANPSTRFYENPEIIATFDPVRTWLTRNHKKYTQTEPPTNKSLATLCFQLLQFQESSLLRSAKSFVKLPAKCFMDFKPGGGLCHVFLTCLKFRHEHNWKKIDFSSSSRVDKHIEMLTCVERELIASKCWEKPVVYIAPLVEKTLAQRLLDAARQMNISVVESASDATHVLHPPPSNWSGSSHEDSTVQRFRVIFHEGRGVLLHWLYSPGSYVTWYTGLQMEWPCEVEPAPQPEPGRPWDVDARWLLYSSDYNDWMVEEDFLTSTSSLRPRTTYSPDEFAAAAAAVACTSGSSNSLQSSTSQYSSAGVTNTPAPIESNSKKKRRRSPSPSVSDPTFTIGSHKKRRPGSSISGERSGRLSAGHSGHRKVRKEDEDEASCQTVPSDAIPEENDLSKDFEDPEPTHRVTAVSANSNAQVVSGSSRPNRVGPITGDVTGGKSILFDLDDEDTGDGIDGINDVHAAGINVDGTPAVNVDETRHPGPAGGGAHTDLSVTEQAHCIVIPSYSAWFDYNAIHGIERRALPEFFNGQNKSKTPEVYLAYRNFMVDTYRLNPQEYLTFTACRRNLTGDVCAILRVHAFLEQWGLINYQVTAPLAAATGLSGGALGGAAEAARLAVAASLGPPSTAHFHVLADSASGLQPVGAQNQAALANTTGVAGQPSTAVGDTSDLNKPNVNAVGKENSEPGLSVNGVSKTDAQTSEGQTMAATTAAVSTSALSNSAAPITALSVTTKPPASVGDPCLRADQYLNSPANAARALGSQGSTDTSKPAAAADVSAANVGTNATLLKGASQGGWTDQETLLLLEALELYRDDWNKVAEHVGSRTQEECILHFLRLPIEDAYLEGSDPLINLTSLANASHPVPPFSKAANPILATVAFLAAAVDPRVAAAAAQAALTEYAKMRDEVPAGLLQEHKARVEAAVRLGQPVDPAKFGLDEVGSGKSLEQQEKKSIPEEVEKPPESVLEPEEKVQPHQDDSAPGEKLEDEATKGPETIKVESLESESSVNTAPSEEKPEETAAEESSSSAAIGPTESTEPMDVSTEEPKQSSATPVETASDTTSPEDELNTGKSQAQSCLPSNPDSLGTAAACALAAAATKARHLASVEEKRIKGLVAQLVETQLKKLDIKLKQMQELEAIMEHEYEMIEQMRQQLLQERQMFHMEVIKTMENRARALVHQQQQAIQLQQQQQQQALAQQQQQPHPQQSHPPNYIPPPPPPPPQGSYTVTQSPHAQYTPSQAPSSVPQHPAYSTLPGSAPSVSVDHRPPGPNPLATVQVSPGPQIATTSPSPSVSYPPTHGGGHVSPTPTQLVQHHPQDGQSADVSWPGAAYSSAGSSSQGQHTEQQPKDVRSAAFAPDSVNIVPSGQNVGIALKEGSPLPTPASVERDGMQPVPEPAIVNEVDDAEIKPDDSETIALIDSGSGADCFPDESAGTPISPPQATTETSLTTEDDPSSCATELAPN
ncbi:SWI SNF, matrix associated, actin dependent regulator of chromatin, sub c, member 2 [Clonorchis sinensis]|uniref:SWI SNF, matrix associated, actin dependent regulator of chromatin, sub c, member 2 n=1 Tax=Clonorchis sinensis TaxID=79923 RepID=A0A419QHC8_CLOSI|nr:SWI SNF, matrix associated, actin dependent regulator of chromatin, sub c, member 2 [Clonorchis sinensis]